MILTFSYDPSTTIGRVRLNCQDTNQATAIFSDEEITAFLTMNNNDIFRSAADALDIIASTQSYLLKRMSGDGCSIDGPAVAADLRAHARALREKADRNIGSTNTGVAIVINPDDPNLVYRMGLI